MMKIFRIIIPLCAILLIVGCDSQCCKLRDSYKLDSCLYLETYLTYCGGFGTELNDVYLTDSLSFRVRLGTYDEHERLEVMKIGNNIQVIKFDITSCKREYDTLNKICLTEKDILKLQKENYKTGYDVPLFGEKMILSKYKHDNEAYFDIAGEYPQVHSKKHLYKLYEEYRDSVIDDRTKSNLIDAIYLSDSSKINLLIAIIKPRDHFTYDIKSINIDTFCFMKIRNRCLYDTLSTETVDLEKLKKSKYKNVCG